MAVSKDKGSVPAPAEKPTKYEDYQVDDAVRTLLQAEEYKQDEKLMDLVHKKISTKKKAIKSISDLRKASNDMYDGDADDE